MKQKVLLLIMILLTTVAHSFGYGHSSSIMSQDNMLVPPAGTFQREGITCYIAYNDDPGNLDEKVYNNTVTGFETSETYVAVGGRESFNTLNECIFEVGAWYITQQPTCSNPDGSVYVQITGGFNQDDDSDNYYDNIYYKIGTQPEQNFPVDGIISGLTPGHNEISIYSYLSTGGGNTVSCGDIITLSIDLSPLNTDLNLIVSTTGATSCGSPTGTISYYVSGGVSPYTFQYNSVGSSAAGNGSVSGNSGQITVTSGKYVLTVTDATGCAVSNSNVIVNAADGGLNVISGNVTAATCTGTTGSFTLSIADGTAPYKYRINENAYVTGFTGSQISVSKLTAGIHPWEIL